MLIEAFLIGSKKRFMTIIKANFVLASNPYPRKGHPGTHPDYAKAPSAKKAEKKSEDEDAVK